MSIRAKKTAIEPVQIKSADLARLLGDTPATLLTRVSRGQFPLPFVRRGATGYYRLADVNHYLKVGRWPHGMRWRGQPFED